MEKTALRRSFLAARRAMPTEVWQQQSRQLCDRLQASPLFMQAQTVLAYFSVRQEPDLSPLLTISKTWGFPRCVGQALVWHTWSAQDSLPLQVGAFGIREPHPKAPTLQPDQVDLLLVPAVACDRRGYRLGYGGGFYDRLLSTPEWANKPTIGLVFDFGLVPQLPTDPWDCPLTAICTEVELFFSADCST